MSYIGNKPANKAVVASDLDPAVITGQTALATSPADTDEFLISDAGTLKRLDASLIGGGKIGQVLQQVNATEVSISSDSATNGVATGLTLAITPSAASSKILVIANIYTNIVDGRGYGIHIMRGTTEVYEDNYLYFQNKMDNSHFLYTLYIVTLN